MIAFLSALYVRPALLLALLVNPLLLCRHMMRRADVHVVSAWTGLLAVLLNVAIMVVMHVAGVRLTAANLALLHWLLFALLLLYTRVRRLSPWPEDVRGFRPVLLVFLVFALLILPVTWFAGVDTYKWQDLATSVQVEQSIPWLLHPVSLLGFSPRSYPSAQPLLLGLVSMLSGRGVHLSYYIFSLFSAAIGVCGINALARTIRLPESSRLLVVIAYVFSPVFVRYNHWATGRGLFLALLPFALAAWGSLPRLRALPALVLSSAALVLSHKTAWVAVPVIALARLIAPLFHARLRKALIPAAVASFALAILVARRVWMPSLAGHIAGLARADITRFGWMLPPALLGLWRCARTDREPASAFLPAGLLLTLPMAHVSDMYGALIALPFVAVLAVLGIEDVFTLRPSWRPGLGACVLVLCAAASLTIVIHRSVTAAPRAAYTAATVLDSLDEGPYRVIAPGALRTQIQAYARGCPRFDFDRTGPVRLHVNTPPAFTRNPTRLVKEWTAYLRHAIGITGVRVYWYGRNPHVYHVIYDGLGSAPEGATLLYDQDGLSIYDGGP